MNYKLFLLILGLYLFFSCDQGKNQEVNQTTKDVGDLMSSDIKSIEYTDFVLGNDASKLLIDWKKFQELNIQMGYLKQGDLSFFKNERIAVKSLFDSLKVSIPDTINTKPIVSRFAVLETQALKLHNNLSMDNIEKATKLSSVKDVLVAFGNLSLQINKKLEYDANEYLRPVD